MDAYDGGSGAPQGRSRADEPQTPRAEGALPGGALPGPRSELPSPQPGRQADPVDAVPADAEPGSPVPGSPVPGSPGADTQAAGVPEAGSQEARVPGAGEPGGVADEAGDPEPVAAEAGEPEAGAPGPRTGVAALSPRYQVCAALALAVVAVAVCLQVGMVFLHVAPSNTVTKAHGKAIDDWIYPEFEQNWKLFAPNPLQQNISVQVRAQVRTADGGSSATGWYDLSAQDGRAIDGNLVPSHTQQNELRRAWDFFTATHDNDNRPVGLRGALAETYLRRIVVLRLERGGVTAGGGVVERVQVRSRTSNVTPPKWSTEKVSTDPVYRELSWWSVPDGAAEGGTR
ncbi:hypothetical protein GCM10010269_11660 [Streptomyces humidus]|uniref:Uncharacterized protein n=1 Tax=Streptomyces humidus TaxID=52259 RepID=A0A918FSL6_9ACTN|nr:DUF5819 family protein [Streptomyces humidus]GGR74292.1 hypothetical protein GCM10010269_11660 [Streptomyces humidus]